MTPSRMLDARSKEPFAVESLDSDFTMSERYSFETDGQSQQVADGSQFEPDSHNTNIFQQSGFHVEENLRHGNTFQGPDGQVEQSSTHKQGRGSLLPAQSTTHAEHGDKQIGQEPYQQVKSERTQQLELEFQVNFEIQQNQELMTNTGDEESSQQLRNRAGQQIMTRDQSENSETAIISELLKVSAVSQSPQPKKQRPAVSAETKARWAMLRSLARAEKGEEKDKSTDANEIQASVGSAVQQLGSEPIAKDGSSATNDWLAFDSEPSSQSRGQVLPRKFSSQIDNKQFALSSKTAVESALRRSGSGRHQSSRGEHIDNESSMSRAASVRRYMEKLRGDPYIDEKHFTVLPAVQEAERYEKPIDPASSRTTRHDVIEDKGLSHSIDMDLEDQRHLVGAVVGKTEQKVHEDGRAIEAAAVREEHVLGQQLYNQSKALKTVARSAGRSLSRDLRDVGETLGNAGHRLEGDMQTLSRDTGRESRSLRENFGKDTYVIEEDLTEGHPIRRDIKMVGLALDEDEQRLVHVVDELKANTNPSDGKLEKDVRVSAEALYFSNAEEELVRDTQALGKVASKLENALGLGNAQQALDQGKQELQQKTRNIEGALRRGSQELEHDAYEIGEALGTGGLEEALSQEFQNLRTKTEAGLKADEYMLSGQLEKAASRTEKALDNFGRSTSRALKNKIQEIKNTPNVLGKALVKPDVHQQPMRHGENPSQNLETQANSRPQGNPIQPARTRHQDPQSENSLRQEIPRSQKQSSPLERTNLPQQPVWSRYRSQKAAPHIPEARPQNLPPMQNQTHQQASSQETSSRSQTVPSQTLLPRPQATQHQQVPAPVSTPQHQKMVPQEASQSQQNGPPNQHILSVPRVSQPIEVWPPQQSSAQQQSSSRLQMPPGLESAPYQEASSHQRGATYNSLPPGHQQIPPLQISQHQDSLPHQLAETGHKSVPEEGAKQRVPSPQQLGQSLRDSPQAHVQNQNRSQITVGPPPSQHPDELLHLGTSSTNDTDWKANPHIKPGQGNKNIDQLRRSDPNVSEFHQIGLPLAVAKTKKTISANCHNEKNHIAGTKEASYTGRSQGCDDSAHLALGSCVKSTPSKQKERSCENVQHLATGSCKEGQPCVKREKEAIYPDGSHLAAGVRSKDVPCTEKADNNSCQDVHHHVSGICSKDGPCTQIKLQKSCQNAKHLTTGVCSKGATCNQKRQHFYYQDANHQARGVCARDSRFQQTPSMAGSEAQNSTTTTVDSQSSRTPKYCWSSLDREEQDQTTTASTISMSPQLGPSDKTLPIPSPHMAVFEQLILGFKRTSQARKATASSARGFADQMTELFVKMAEDALPAIRQRLGDNARG